MDTNPTIWIGILILLVCSAFFASAETSIFSLNRLQVQHLRRFSPYLHQLVDFFLTRPRRTLVTILVGNEIVNLLTTILITSFYASQFPNSSWVIITLCTLATSATLIIMISDITPKAIAIRYPIEFVKLNSLPLKFVYTLLTPLRIIFAAISGRIISLIAGHPSEQHKEITEAEIKMLVQEGAEEGVIGKEEQKMIFNVFRFGDSTAARIMTPAEKVISLPLGLTVEEMIRKIKEYPFSRIPIYKDHPENIIGLLHTKELLKIKDLKKELTTSSLIIKPLFVTPDKSLDNIFREFRSQRTHMAIVVNTQNQLMGIVTMDDLLQELFGTFGQEERRRPNGT